MSKAFTKDDAPVEAVFAPRPPLPEGVVNYVTPRGLASLSDELTRARAERSHVESMTAGADRDHAVAAVQSRLAELEERLASAVVVDPATFSHDKIRLGAHVTVQSSAGVTKRLQIVGVDEADAGAGRIAFLSPVGRALLGREVGDEVTVQTPRGAETLEVVAVDYAKATPRGDDG